MRGIIRRMLPVLVLPFAQRKSALLSGKAFRVLTYHRVNTHRFGDRLSVRRDMFGQQLDWLLQNGYNTLTLREAAAGLEENAWPEKAVVITFDDGYADNLFDAYAELSARKLSATFFVTVDWIGVPGAIPGCTGGDERDRAMTWEELGEIAADPHMEVGSHTCSHPSLSQISDIQLEREIGESREILKEKLGEDIVSFAYPKGDYDDRSLRKAECYSSAVTVKPGYNDKEVSRLELRRTEISGEDRLVDFERKLSGAFDLLHHLLALMY